MKVEASQSFFDSLKRIGSLGEKLRNIRSWLHFHFHKDFLHLLGVVLKSYPWDYSFLYYMEKAKIEEMRKYHERNDSFVGQENSIRYMKICEKLIDIITEKKEIFTYSGEIKFNKQENGNYAIDTSDCKYQCFVNVNTKNLERFVKKEKLYDFYKKHPHELYLIKARHLYHKIRAERDDYWWV